jgi:hypothetical protein
MSDASPARISNRHRLVAFHPSAMSRQYRLPFACHLITKTFWTEYADGRRFLESLHQPTFHFGSTGSTARESSPAAYAAIRFETPED